MAIAARTPRSTRPLSEVTKHLVQPAGMVSSDWVGRGGGLRRVCRRELGVTFDGWQDGAAQLALARRSDGTLAATVGGVGMSVMRQVGKTFMFAAIDVTLCISRPGTKLLWTSHHLTTSGETFLQMQAFCQRPQVDRYIDKIYLGSGDEEVRFHNKSRIIFGARERGFGIGIPRVDGILFDEAQILSAKALENMLATMNQSTLGLHVYCGTPPKPGDQCEQFVAMRNEALSGEATELVWIEIGAEPDVDVDKHETFLVNPSYPEHTPLVSMLRLRKKLGTDAFRRQGLGIWETDLSTVFDLVAWVNLENAKAKQPPKVTLVVHVSPYRATATIAVAGNGSLTKADPPGTGLRRTLVMVNCLDVGEVAAKVAQLKAGRDIVEVALTDGEARGLQADLTKAGIEFVKMTPGEIAASCTAFQAGVTKGTVEHVGQRELDVAVANARTRRSGNAETWDQDPLAVDVGTLVAAAAAFQRWGMQEIPPEYDVLQSVW
jgi:hypothetical protein